MTWRMATKIVGQSFLTGSLTVPISVRVLAQTASASADYETSIFSPLTFVQQTGFPGIGTNIGSPAPYTGLTETHVITRAFIITDSAVTGGGAGLFATAKIRLYSSAGVLVGTLFSTLFTNSPQTSTVAFAPFSLGSPITTLRAASNLGGGFGLRANESLTFEWLQSATTGLALPATVVVLDVV